ncbi:MAG: Lrp/AsnC family transcriptional regulator [Firmicutes bacterium]|jgi:Lrp/AsnC family transcriptional regulator for asnA, asnC and gidA|nr:Lrp/AsnC family transcriptional regulator [Bacillota bacterium]
MDSFQSPGLDDLDRRILRYLQQDGRIPFTAIAQALDLAEGTVRKRVNRLIEEGVLKIVGVLNPNKIGLGTLAIVGVKLTGDKVGEVIAQIEQLPQVRYLAICTGVYDVIMEVVVANTEELYVFLTKTLRSISGVASSDTSLVMKVGKHSHEWQGP